MKINRLIGGAAIFVVMFYLPVLTSSRTFYDQEFLTDHRGSIVIK